MALSIRYLAGPSSLSDTNTNITNTVSLSSYITTYICYLSKGACDGNCGKYHLARGRKECTNCSNGICPNKPYTFCGKLLSQYIKKSQCHTHISENCIYPHSLNNILLLPLNKPCNLVQSQPQPQSQPQSQHIQHVFAPSPIPLKPKVLIQSKLVQGKFCSLHNCNCVDNGKPHLFLTGMNSSQYDIQQDNHEATQEKLSKIGVTLDELRISGFYCLSVSELKAAESLLKNKDDGLDKIADYIYGESYLSRLATVQGTILERKLKQVYPLIVDFHSWYKETFYEIFQEFDEKDHPFYKLLKNFHKTNLSYLILPSEKKVDIYAMESAVDALLKALGMRALSELPHNPKSFDQALFSMIKHLKDVVDTDESLYEIVAKLERIQTIIRQKADVVSAAQIVASKSCKVDYDKIVTVLTAEISKLYNHVFEELKLINDNQTHSKRIKYLTEKSNALNSFVVTALEQLDADPSAKTCTTLMQHVIVDGIDSSLDPTILTKLMIAIKHKQSVEKAQSTIKSNIDFVVRFFQNMPCLFKRCPLANFFEPSNKIVKPLSSDDIFKIAHTPKDKTVKVAKSIVHGHGTVNLMDVFNGLGNSTEGNSHLKALKVLKANKLWRLLMGEAEVLEETIVKGVAPLQAFVNVAKEALSTLVQANSTPQSSAESWIKMVQSTLTLIDPSYINWDDDKLMALLSLFFGNISVKVIDLIDNALGNDNVAGYYNFVVKVSNLHIKPRTFSIADLQMKPSLKVLQDYLEKKIQPMSTPSQEPLNFRMTIKLPIRQLAEVYYNMWEKELITTCGVGQYATESLLFDLE
jgi:hypothetical protein